MASDWMAAELPANQKPCWKIPLKWPGFNMELWMEKLPEELDLSHRRQTGQPASATWEWSEENGFRDSIVTLCGWWWNNVIGIIEVATTDHVQIFKDRGSWFVLLHFSFCSKVFLCARGMKKAATRDLTTYKFVKLIDQIIGAFQMLQRLI